MSERVRFFTLYVLASCLTEDGGICWAERVENPTPDQQKTLIRHARQHARRCGRHIGIERGQTAGIEA